MNAQDLLDYTLGQFDEVERVRFEQELAADPAAADRLSRLEARLSYLLDDGLDPEPPADLARRTSLRRQALVDRELQPTLEFAPPPQRSLWWRDYAAVAAVLLLGIGMTLPAIQSSRMAFQNVGCMNNLMRIGQGVQGYLNSHQVLPAVDPVRGAPARNGIQFARLLERGLLEPESLDCPGNGPDHLIGQASRVRTAKGSPSYLERIDYAAPMGYFESSSDPQNRQWRPPGYVSNDTLTSLIPVASDRPPCGEDGTALEGNSPNHGGHGQFVGFADMHVGRFPTRRIGIDPDMFLNHLQHTAPGVEPNDHVLGTGQLVVPQAP